MAVKKILKAIQKKWITVWLVVAAVSLSAITAYAIYTRITIAKRVVSTQAGASSLFSSDYMNTGGMKSIEPITDNTQNASVPFHLYNYAYPKEAVYRSDSTEYDLTATIGSLDDSDVFTELSDSSLLSGLTYCITYNLTGSTFVFNSTNGTSHKFSNCLISGNGANSDLFTLVFDKNELGANPKGYCIKLEADPYNTDLPKLIGYVMVRYSKPVSAGWSGDVEEIDVNKDYDGFNYYLTGNGKGKITFKWNRSKVTINKDFLKNPNNEFDGYDGAQPVEADLTEVDGYVSLTLKVDSTKKNRYEIQFFKVNPAYSYSKTDVESYLPTSTDWVPDATS